MNRVDVCNLIFKETHVGVSRFGRGGAEGWEVRQAPLEGRASSRGREEESSDEAEFRDDD